MKRILVGAVFSAVVGGAYALLAVHALDSIGDHYCDTGKFTGKELCP